MPTLSIKSFLKFLTPNNLFILLFKLYQNTFSYFLGGHCKFYPSCSHYAVESFERHNFFQAFKLVIIRLSKCHPLSFQEGFDPVPLKQGKIK